MQAREPAPAAGAHLFEIGQAGIPAVEEAVVEQNGIWFKLVQEARKGIVDHQPGCGSRLDAGGFCAAPVPLADVGLPTTN